MGKMLTNSNNILRGKMREILTAKKSPQIYLESISEEQKIGVMSSEKKEEIMMLRKLNNELNSFCLKENQPKMPIKQQKKRYVNRISPNQQNVDNDSDQESELE